jgi:aromatic-L-amino-acid decarboxylase
MSVDVQEHPFELPPETLREWLSRAVDFALRWLEREARDPVLETASGPALMQRLGAAPPRAPGAFEEVFAEFEQLVARHARANGHPRFFAYVSASADPAGIVAELLAAALNQNVTAWRSSPGAASVERLVLRWLDELLGFDGGNGILTGGGSAANFNALVMAVTRGEQHGVSRDAMAIYLSEDTHLSLAKAARVLGLRPENIRALPVDAQRRMRTDALADAVDRDRQHGAYPLLVCASAGTANCGAIDPIEEMAELARRERLWLHVDGAYGAPAALTPSHAWLRDAFARADSLSIDPHKWLYAPLDIGCLLFRDGELAKRAFSETAAYTRVTQTDAVEAHAFFDHGMELSRRFRALKLWFALRLHGADAYARMIEHNIEVRRHLDERIDAHPRLERVASGLSISCFRALEEGGSREQSNALNRRILDRLLEGGRFLLSPTELSCYFVLRVCIVSFRTRRHDIDMLIDSIDSILETA